MPPDEDRETPPPDGMYRVVGVCADGTRELCAAAVGKQIAETVAALERKIRDYSEVVIEPDGTVTSAGKRSRGWN